ncbi:hypothetical protein OR1_01593 [Geobacter sp. OR-1]|uniref:DUF3373 domain-containing protein n=1 Tax=Geobacter sp. OR-1 TaxID=1266765 RepID=UPI000543878F|nr:DUF3373 domain-containing protein [Geobacter sp. OR-1]GAM09318.1 hypothetical protein OR1_01593 [Geobacter sp. OR-1]
MNRLGKRLVTVTLAAGLAMPAVAMAADDLTQKIDMLQKEVDALKQQVKKHEDKAIEKWLTIGGDYRFRLDSLRGEVPAFANAMTFANTFMRTGDQNAAMAAAMTPAAKPENKTLYTNRFGLDLHAKATSNVTVNARLLMYKTFGAQDDNAVTGAYFSDRVGVFDGTIGHIPADGALVVDRAYATWANIADSGVWFSAGRRPSTNWAPEHLRLNNERPGNGGVPALMVDYAYDGMTLGWAPDIEALPGAYAKLCYGRGFESGLSSSANSVKHDMDMFGFNLTPYDTDPLRLFFQYNRGFNLTDTVVMNNTAFGNTAPSVQLGDVDWFGIGADSIIKKVGPGTLNTFGQAALSVSRPNGSVSAQFGNVGLMNGTFMGQPSGAGFEDKTGWAVLVGARYDYDRTKTKLGFEYNHGSQNWITMTPASDDMWTSKYGTRGNVYEGYVIQELNMKPVSSYLAKVFFKVGYQYYDFEYTGSNNWVGAAQKISDIKPTTLQLLAPVKSAQDLYATFEVKF